MCLSTRDARTTKLKEDLTVYKGFRRDEKGKLRFAMSHTDRPDFKTLPLVRLKNKAKRKRIKIWDGDFPRTYLPGFHCALDKNETLNKYCHVNTIIKCTIPKGTRVLFGTENVLREIFKVVVTPLLVVPQEVLKSAGRKQ